MQKFRGLRCRWTTNGIVIGLGLIALQLIVATTGNHAWQSVLLSLIWSYMVSRPKVVHVFILHAILLSLNSGTFDYSYLDVCILEGSLLCC